MNEREELELLRKRKRLLELEQKAGGGMKPTTRLDEVKTIGSMAGNLAGMSVAGIGGMLQPINPFSGDQSSAQVVEDIQNWFAEALPEVDPRTGTAKLMQFLGDVSNKAGAGLAGTTSLLTGGGLEGMQENIRETEEQGLSKQMGEKTLEATNSPLLATAAEMSIPSAEALGGYMIATMKPRQQRRELARRIEEGDIDIDTITKTLDENGNLITNPNTKKAIKLLGDDIKGTHLAVLFENMNDATRKQFNRMLDTVETGYKKGHEYIMENRPINIVGESIANRAKRLVIIKKRASRKLESATKSLKGNQVETSSILDDLINDLSKENITVFMDDSGKLKLDMREATSGLGDSIKKSDVETWINRLAKGELDAEYAHRFKKQIRENLDFSEGALVGAPISAGVSNAFKGVARKINEKLGAINTDYKKANDVYSSLTDALKRVEKQLGGVDLDSEFASSKLGAISKRIGSNLASREQVIQMIDELDSALKSNGYRYKDNIKQQVAAMGQLDAIFKIDPLQSPFGFQAGIGKGAASVAAGDNIGMFHASIETLKNLKAQDFDSKIKALRAMSRPRGR